MAKSMLDELPGGDVKIGGKSIYLYGGAIGAVVVIYLWWSGRNNDGYTQTAAEPPITYSDVGGDLGDLPKSTTGDNQDLDIPGETNAVWETKVIAWLVTQGVNPLSAQRAIQLYQQGEQLDYNQTNILNKAVAKFGPPPEGIYSAPMTTDKPPVAAKPAELKWKTKTQRWNAVGTVNAYAGPSRSARVKSRRKPGTYIVTRQYSGSWVRNTAGTYYNVNDLAPYVKPKPKPRAKPKPKTKK